MTRRCVPLLLLALLIAVPSTASAQSLDEASCRAAGGSVSLCRGLDKLGERVSAECRRTGLVSDEQCWSRIGRRVIRSDIARYEESWVHEALELQYALGSAVPFRDAPWIGTHNSYNSTSEQPSVSHTDSNQQLTLAEQLRIDVRSLEVDVHWIPSVRAGGANAVVVCHGQKAGPVAVGCTTEEHFEPRLREIAGWLEDNEDQVLLLYLENDMDSPAGEAAAAQIVRDVVGDRLYAPAGGGGCTKLPLGLTRDAVRAARKQVVIVSDCASGAWNGIAHAWKGDVSWEARPKGWGTGADTCGPPTPDVYATRLVRFYEDSTWLSTTPASSPDDGLTPATVERMVACGVDLFGFDQILPFDGRLEAAVWTWAGAAAAAEKGECAIQFLDEAGPRWDGRKCGELHRPACVAADRNWLVLAERTDHRGAADACRAAGLTLGTPRTGRENEQLRAAAGSATTWIGYTRPGKKKPPGKKR